MFEQKPTIERRGESILATNKVLRNTYFLLALTLVFSALTASYAMATQVGPLKPHPHTGGLLCPTVRNTSSA